MWTVNETRRQEMLTMVTGKKPNGRRLVYLVLEPNDLDHMKLGEPSHADSSNIQGHDIMVCYAPDVEKFRDILAGELRKIDPSSSAGIADVDLGEILKTVQQYPELRRPTKAAKQSQVRQDVGKKAN